MQPLVYISDCLESGLNQKKNQSQNIFSVTPSMYKIWLPTEADWILVKHLSSPSVTIRGLLVSINDPLAHYLPPDPLVYCAKCPDILNVMFARTYVSKSVHLKFVLRISIMNSGNMAHIRETRNWQLDLSLMDCQNRQAFVNVFSFDKLPIFSPRNKSLPKSFNSPVHDTSLCADLFTRAARHVTLLTWTFNRSYVNAMHPW